MTYSNIILIIFFLERFERLIRLLFGTLSFEISFQSVGEREMGNTLCPFPISKY